jgi:hypothetical protein
MKAFPSFVENCARQGVDLDLSLIAAGLSNESSLSLTVEPDGYYSAVAEAGVLLRANSTIPLANAPIPERRFNFMSGQPHPGEQALRTIVNSSITPWPGSAREGTAYSTTEPVSALSTCGDAEEWFSHVIKQMEQPEQPAWYGNFIGYQIFTSPQGRAIAIRKSLDVGQPSTLTLTQTTINGIAYPAGSLMRASTDRSQRAAEGEQQRVSTNDITRIGFLRLSAFAVPLANRRDFLPKLEGCTDNTAREVLRGCAIGRAQQIAQRALKHTTTVSQSTAR